MPVGRKHKLLLNKGELQDVRSRHASYRLKPPDVRIALGVETTTLSPW
jgi:hypothetical protein